MKRLLRYPSRFTLWYGAAIRHLLELETALQNGVSNGIMEGSMAQYRYIMVTGDFYSRIQAKAEVIGKIHIVEGIVTVSTSSDMAQTSAAADSTQVFDIGGSTYHMSLGTSFDRPVITSGKRLSL